MTPQNDFSNLKVIISYVQSNRESNSRPQRVTASYPIPELEHIISIDSKVFDFGGVGRECHKVLSSMLVQAVEQHRCAELPLQLPSGPLQHSKTTLLR